MHARRFLQLRKPSVKVLHTSTLLRLTPMSCIWVRYVALPREEGGQAWTFFIENVGHFQTENVHEVQPKHVVWYKLDLSISRKYPASLPEV